QPGQGAQVSTLGAGSASVIFNESDKAPGQFTSSNRNNLAEPGMLTVQLFTTDNFINGGPVHDSFGILFDDNYNNALTFADAVKPMNFQANNSIGHSGTYLSLEQRKMRLPSEIYPLYSTGYTQTNYTFSISVDGLENIILSLDHHFTGSSTILEPGVNSYSFNVDVSDELSIATDRFTIRTELRLGMEDNNLLSGIRIFPNPLNSTT